MPTSRRFCCKNCNFVGQNRRALARHMSEKHEDTIHKCPYGGCNFVSCYKTNLMRHARDVHGLRELKCELCGFFATTIEELFQHREANHKEDLERLEKLYEQEKLRIAADNSELDNHNTETNDTLEDLDYDPEMFNIVEEDISNDEPTDSSDSKKNGNSKKRDSDGKLISSAMDDPMPPFTCDTCGLILQNPRELLRHQKDVHHENFVIHECEHCIFASTQLHKFHRHLNLVHKDKLQETTAFLTNFSAQQKAANPPPPPPVTLGLPVLKRLPEPGSVLPPPPPLSQHRLPQLSPRPQSRFAQPLVTPPLPRLTCHAPNQNPFLTQPLFTPQILPHQGPSHLTQALLGATPSPHLSRSLTTHFNSPQKAPPLTSHPPLTAPPASQPQITSFLEPARKRPGDATTFSCSMCHFQTRSKFLLGQHEKTNHAKKRFFKCKQCNYITNKKIRYVEHLRAHELSPQQKLKCSMCDFTSLYRGNLEKHMRTHFQESATDYNCGECPFTTNDKQELMGHLASHLGPSRNPVQNEEEDDEEMEDDEEGLKMDEFGSWPSQQTFKDLQLKLDSLTQKPESLEVLQARHDELAFKQGKYYMKSHKCRFCPFKAAFPYEIAKHEASHESFLIKRHPCPICGVRFYHLTGLARHVSEEHRDNANAKSIVACAEMLSEQRKKKRRLRPPSPSGGGSYSVNGMEITTVPPLPQTATRASPVTFNLHPDLEIIQQPPPSPVATKPSNHLLPAPEVHPSMEIIEHNISPHLVNSMMDRKTPTCHICGLKTKWMSELIKHVRVHSNNKPFKCKICNYECKWKGDLNRHMKLLGHGEPSPERELPAISIQAIPDKIPPESHGLLHSKLRKLLPKESQEAIVDLTSGENKVLMPKGGADKIVDFTCPADLFAKAFPYYKPQSGPDGKIESQGQGKALMDCNNAMPLEITIDEQPIEIDPDMDSPNLCDPLVIAETPKVKQKNYLYKCPHCSFVARTASRFHVHIIQHLNTRPFMCSVCGYRSNWQWDITKHLKMKGLKDPAHNDGKVLLTHETGMRDYSKYKEYLVEVDSDEEGMVPIEDHKKPGKGSETSDSPKKGNDSESIVVTPDIAFSEENEFNDLPMPIASPNTPLPQMLESTLPTSSEKLFKCAHCSYQKSSKKVVISHLGSHAGVIPYACKLCGLTSRWPNAIHQHLKNKHNSDSKNMECRIKYSTTGHVVSLDGLETTRELQEPDNGFNQMEEDGEEASMFSCEHCPYKCEKLYHMKFHMKQHKPREGAIFKCMFCPYYVKFRKSLVLHMRLHGITDEDLTKNKNNFKLALSPTLLSEELAKEEPPPPPPKKFNCQNCPYATDNKSQILYHKQFHRPNKNAPYKCTICNYWTSRHNLLGQHFRLHKSSTNLEEVNAVREIGELDSSEVPVVRVKKGDTIVTMFKCRFCPMKTQRKKSVLVHEKMHTQSESKKFTCPYCNYQSDNHGVLGAHMKWHSKQSGDDSSSPPEPENFPVNKVPPLKLNLNSLSPVKKANYSLFCDKCPAAFKSSRDLVTHQTFHGSVYPHMCPHCDYRARHKPHLNKHLVVHTKDYIESHSRDDHHPPEFQEEDLEEYAPENERNATNQLLLLEEVEVRQILSNNNANKHHRCLLCPAAFTKAATLNFHMSLHGSIGEFKCQQCDYEVNSSQNFSYHEQLHYKSKPNKPKVNSCTKCPATFTKLKRWEKHLALHGSNQKYACEKCDYSTNFPGTITKHRLLHRPEDSQIYFEKNLEYPKLKLKKSSPPHHSIEELSQAHSSHTAALAEVHKKFLTCEYCPYMHTRKECMTRHTRRHGVFDDGMQCPYCDFNALQTSFLKEHIKLHLQRTQLSKPQAYIRFENSEIWSFSNQEKLLLFKEKEEKTEERFYPQILESLKENHIVPTNEALSKVYSELLSQVKVVQSDEDETDIDYDLAKMNTGEDTSTSLSIQNGGVSDKETCDNNSVSSPKSEPNPISEDSQVTYRGEDSESVENSYQPGLSKETNSTEEVSNSAEVTLPTEPCRTTNLLLPSPIPQVSGQG